MLDLFDQTVGKTWVFTGGEFAAGGFTVNQAFRSTSGLFEEVIRWDMGNVSVAGRERFVFNTAKAGLNVLDIKREFEERIAYYHPAAVVYLSGREDRALDREAFQEGLRELERLTRQIGAEWFLAYAGEDSLESANEILRMVGAAPSLVTERDRSRWKLVPVRDEDEGAGGTASQKLSLYAHPMRWLFIGDSITHGALHTYGFDSVAQLWEKYLRGDLNRPDDVVLNTGVSGATAKEFLGRLDVRYTPYADADVVIAMFGTNDCCFPGVISVEQFKGQLRRIISLVRGHGAQFVLRVPQPQKKEAGERKQALVPFAEAVREVAEQEQVILVDHFQSFGCLEEHEPEKFELYMNDGIHPGAAGHYQMFRELAYGTGLAIPMSMLSYQLAKER